MFTPDPPSRHRLLPPDWFVIAYNTNRPQGEPPATWLDPHVMALWHAISLQPPPSPLMVNGVT
jgi:hypothetical protein